MKTPLRSLAPPLLPLLFTLAWGSGCTGDATACDPSYDVVIEGAVRDQDRGVYVSGEAVLATAPHERHPDPLPIVETANEGEQRIAIRIRDGRFEYRGKFLETDLMLRQFEENAFGNAFYLKTPVGHSPCYVTNLLPVQCPAAGESHILKVQVACLMSGEAADSLAPYTE